MALIQQVTDSNLLICRNNTFKALKALLSTQGYVLFLCSVKGAFETYTIHINGKSVKGIIC